MAVFVEQAQIQQALGQHLDRGFMRVGELGAGTGGRNGCILAGQDQVVQRPLGTAEAAIGREGAGDVAGIAIELAACVNQDQLAIAHLCRIGAVVQHAGIGPGGHNGAIRRKLRAMAAKLVQQLGLKMVFAQLFPGAQAMRAGLHGPHMGACTDVRGAPHDGQFMMVFDQAHLIQQSAQIALFAGALGAKTHARANFLQPAIDACFQAVVGGKRVPDGAPVFQQAWHQPVQIGDGVRCLNFQLPHGRLGT